MEYKITAELREKTGKEISKQLRRENFVPAVLYGEKKDSIALSVKVDDIKEVLKSERGVNQPLRLKYGKKTEDAMIYELQHDYLGRDIIHIDFLRVDLDKPVDITVPIHLIGTPIGVKQEDGLLDFVTREIDLSCLPKDIINNIEVDISELHVGQSVKVQDIELDERYKIVTDSSVVIATVSSHVVEEVVEEEEVEETEEEAAAAEAETKEGEKPAPEEKE
jgi:large subunit ribosomal protein L25